MKLSHIFVGLSMILATGSMNLAHAQEESSASSEGGTSRYFSSLLFGGAYNFATPLDIQIDDRDNISFSSAEYSVRPFEGSFYYVLRGGWMDENFTGWELELLHHKLYLENEHPDIQEFTITDGYNGLNVNRLIQWKGLNLRLGGGLVITHPETIIYNRKYSWDQGIAGTGYHISGVGARATIGKFFALNDNWFIETEAGVWATYSKIPVFNGEATIPHASINADIGLGYLF